MAITEQHWDFMCLCRAGPLAKLLEYQPPQTKRRSRCFLIWLRAVSQFSLITPQYGQKSICLCLPPMLIDCLTRHPGRWKFVSRSSLSLPMWKPRGTMAVKLGGPAFMKADRAKERCFSKLSLVYKGTQSGSAVNWSG